MNAVELYGHIMPLPDIDHIRMQFGKVVTLIKSVPSMLPIGIPLKGLVVENRTVLKVVGLEMFSNRPQVISQ